ncbi:GCN5-related N-acetyltransferase [Dinoroseobacter shibae DFL 12 = DSM 16493]|uniref:GCN5-related N-acetyltransferase n=1 Tax=Dinoroseobacter shibae (strain DSM 16493 / NCIMB 14021 / DFL 12) TaxID=398580 RepID=A8LQT8_DINSH|nr:GNAT family N-acetyltransferase [Dinoroseobacter shibae]ABV92481.1 GCN5-related N-acetyltransferase [Dinoroseobacter shibae DFL 12 = DSM 16493]URF47425.1 N-acetyltransferase family protein [Dinoroseobacter shibae]URF51736.1 N-acetyltransferase family protein [Dinoroseobacter shibae]
MIRPATQDDAAQIAALWSALIRDTTVTFNSHEKTAADITALLADKAAADQPFLVALHAGRVAGFATYGPFRNGPGYARTIEHSILLDTAARGQGLGRGLMSALEDHARTRGMHTLWAGVSGENPAGVTFHRHLGFAEVATLREVGYKFGRWIDLVLMCKRL